MSDKVSLTGRLKFETPKAYLFTEDDETEVWLPKWACLVEIDDEDPKFVTITIPRKMAEEKGLI